MSRWITGDVPATVDQLSYGVGRPGQAPASGTLGTDPGPLRRLQESGESLGVALVGHRGFRNLTNYIARSLLETGR